MENDRVKNLGARLLGEKVADLDSALRSVEAVVPLSAAHRRMLTAIGGPVLFDNGAKFTTDEPSSLNNKNGYQSLEVLYGLGAGKNSIVQRAANYAGELPPAFVPIGEAPGGNLIAEERGHH